MSSVGRLNIDVTATTGKFDAAMAGVRRQIGGVGRAGSAAGALGGMGMPAFGAIGAAAGLSGPLIAVTAGLAALTGAMKDREKDTQKASDALDLALTRNIGLGQAGLAIDVGSQLGTGGEAILDLIKAASTGAGFAAIQKVNPEAASAIQSAASTGDFTTALQVLRMLSAGSGKTEVNTGLGGSGDLAATIDAGLAAIQKVNPEAASAIQSAASAGDFTTALQLLQKQSSGSGKMEIAKALGGSGDEFLRLQRAVLNLGSGVSLDSAERALQQQNFQAADPNWFERAVNAIFEFFGGNAQTYTSLEQTDLLRTIAAQQGPGI